MSERVTDDEIAFRAAINLLRDSVESGRMPNGVPLTPEASALHEHVAQHCEARLKRISATCGVGRTGSLGLLHQANTAALFSADAWLIN